MGAALIIAWKDLRQRARDRSAFLIAIVLPLAMAVIFNLILGGIDPDDVSYRYAVADEDNGLAAKAFVEQALLPLQDSGLIELEQADSRGQAVHSVDMGSASAAFIIPEGFSFAVENAQPAQLEIIGAVDQLIAGLVANSIAEAFVQEVRVVQISVAASTIGQGAAEPSRALVERASARPNPIVLADVSATKKELDAKTFFSAGMAVFFLFFTVQFGVSSIMDERRAGTLARLLAAPVAVHWIIVGKLLTSLCLGTISMAVLAVATTGLLGADWGAPYGVALLIVAGVLAATAVMVLVATLARTAEEASNWQAIIALVLGMLGGSFFPLGQAGWFVSTLSLITPHAWFLRGLDELQSGGGLTDIGPALGGILVFALVTGTAAFLRRRRLVQL